jgi:hypothetical protein
VKALGGSLRWVRARRRRLAVALVFALVLVLLAHPGALGDVYGNIGPAPQLPAGGWVGRYPLERYSLDQFFPAISVGFTSGVDASGVTPMIAYFGAQVLWLLTSFLANGVILLFALAFNLNLLTGNGTPGSGALTPVSAAIHNLYTSTFGAPWLIAMVVLVGCWAMWKALVQRRYTETAGALAVSLLYFVLALGIVTQPERTIAPASKLSNEISTALLSLTSEGSIGSESQAKTGASNQLFELLVLNPWTVLEFGGIEHCASVSHGKARSVAVRPLSSNPATDTQLAAQLESGTEVAAEGKTCINNRNKYAAHFLAYPFQSKARNSEHEALENGDSEDLPETDPAKTNGTYPLGPADEPAAEAMGKGGQYERLGLAGLILLGELGAYLLLGALALGVILAQILLLMLLAFAPVALLIGIFPGRGHDFFRAWLSKLAGYLARKVIYSLILAVVLAVCSALEDATSNLGWLLAFSLQAAFLWTVFLQRNRLTADLLAGTVGPGAPSEGTSRLANLYYASRLARTFSAPHIPWRSSPGAPPTPPASKPGAAGPSPDETPPPGGGDATDGTPPGGGPPPAPSGAGEPGAHETPTHGPGAPTPSPSTPAAAPAAAAQAPPAVAGERQAGEDELAAADSAPPQPQPPQGSPAVTAASSRPPGADPPAPRSATTSTAGAAPARPAAITATPLPAPPSSGEQPPAPRTPAPAASPQTLGGELPASNSPTPGASPRPAPQSSRGEAPVVAAVPGEEPVALLLKARQATGPADPATKEDDLV